VEAAVAPAGIGTRLHDLAAELFPINRSITGPGFRRTLEILERTTGPMERHRFATGEQVFDWTVPPEWTLRDAWLKAPDGRVVCSLAESNLSVVGYSAPVHERLDLDALQPHLHSLPEQPDAIPYRTSYYAESWGFCLPDRVRRELPPGEYEAFVDADLAPGHVEVGEVVVPGTGEGEVLFWTYCCHPSMANNELSGPVVVAHLAERLRERAEPPRLTYRFAFGPETIGAIAYLSRFGEELRERLVAGYVVTCVGVGGPPHYKRSRRGDSLADRAAEHVLREHGRHVVRDFYPLGADERQFCSPGFDLPVGSLMQTPYFEYPEYHTSLDDLALITPEVLAESFALYARVVDTLEANETFRNLMPYCEPQLGKRGLYPSTGGPTHRERRVHDIMQVLNACDGDVDLLAVSDRAQRPAWELREVADELERAGLLARVP
jgi:aminopeptidase-like protein